MKIHTTAAPDKARPVLLLAADVSRDMLHLSSRFESGPHLVSESGKAEESIGHRISGKFHRRTPAVDSGPASFSAGQAAPC